MYTTALQAWTGRPPKVDGMVTNPCNRYNDLVITRRFGQNEHTVCSGRLMSYIGLYIGAYSCPDTQHNPSPEQKQPILAMAPLTKNTRGPNEGFDPERSAQNPSPNSADMMGSDERETSPCSRAIETMDRGLIEMIKCLENQLARQTIDNSAQLDTCKPLHQEGLETSKSPPYAPRDCQEIRRGSSLVDKDHGCHEVPEQANHQARPASFSRTRDDDSVIFD